MLMSVRKTPKRDRILRIVWSRDWWRHVTLKVRWMSGTNRLSVTEDWILSQQEWDVNGSGAGEIKSLLLSEQHGCRICTVSRNVRETWFLF